MKPKITITEKVKQDVAMEMVCQLRPSKEALAPQAHLLDEYTEESV